MQGNETHPDPAPSSGENPVWVVSRMLKLLTPWRHLANWANLDVNAHSIMGKVALERVLESVKEAV